MDKLSIVPVIPCNEATKLWDSLPPKEQLVPEDAIALALIEKHRAAKITHDPSCFVLRPIN